MCILVFCKLKSSCEHKKPLETEAWVAKENLFREGKTVTFTFILLGQVIFFLPPPPISSQNFERFKPVILGSLISHRKKIQKLLSKISDKISIFQMWKINKIKIIFPDQDWPGYSWDSLTSLFSPHPLLLYLRFFSQLFREISENKNFFPGNIVI